MAQAHHRFDNEKRRRPDSHKRQAMLTPSYALEPIRMAIGGIDLDPCTEPDNPTCAKSFFHLPDDGCGMEWVGSVFCNPPYGEAKDRWVKKCIEHGEGGNSVALLIPSHTETRIFQEALSSAHSTLFVKARLRFGVLRENGRQEAASHGSAVFFWNAITDHVRDLGTLMSRG